MTNTPAATRRTFLKGAGLTLGSRSIAGCSALLGSPDETTTLTPALSPTQRVLVGPSGEDVFDPASVQLPPGGTVIWTWKSDFHNIIVEEQPEQAMWKGHEQLEREGFTHRHTFEVEGTYVYSSHHGKTGMIGQVIVTRTPAPTPPSVQWTPSPAPTPTPIDFTDVRGQREVTVAVAPDGEFSFEPAALRLSAGTEVTWVWQSDGHNITVGERPPAATWQGTPRSPDKVYDEGYSYTHTFTVRGRYEYWCYPHQSPADGGTILVE